MAETTPPSAEPSLVQRFRSFFSKSEPSRESSDEDQEVVEEYSPTFVPSSPRSSFHASEDAQSLHGWELAKKYHELKRSGLPAPELRRLREESARVILLRARRMMGALSQPTQNRFVHEELKEQDNAELSIDETLDESPLGEDRIWEEKARRIRPLILVIDTSLSMNGEKLALTAVSIAIALLHFERQPVGIVAFENEAQVLKRPKDEVPLLQVIERFLDVPAQGYTHLEAGLLQAIQLKQGLGVSRVPILLISDGKYTAGKDPTYLGGQLSPLWMMKMGGERTSRDFASRLVKASRGEFVEVRELPELPRKMYEILRSVVRS